MNHKRSMRIFWFTLCLLLICGAAIIAAVQYRSHRNNPQGQKSHMQYGDTKVQAETGDTAAGLEIGNGQAGSQEGWEKTPQAQKNTSSGEQVQPASGGAAAYQFELKICGGYLDVYHCHTGQLFFHTGIPCAMLTDRQCQELERGKFFQNEQELYGYLESCTS